MRTGCVSCISQIFCCAKIGKKKPTFCVTKGQGQRQIRWRRTSHKRRYKNKNQRDGMRGAYAKRFSANAPPVVALFSCFLVCLRVIGVCLSRRPRRAAPRVTGGDSRPSAQPPTCIKTVTYFYGHFCSIVYILLISFCKFFKNTPACAPSICV